MPTDKISKVTEVALDAQIAELKHGGGLP